METIIITPGNERQSNLVKLMLKEMRIHFTSHIEDNEIGISDAEMETIDRLYHIRGIEISEEVPTDFHRAISVDEAKGRVQKGLRKIFKEKREGENI
ncbi:MAG TPA: hypothetical protein DDW85_09025 [Porphyromonadaceae bacterium]|nr:hypothetical protein [Porphyromonadaceae bacterium]